MYSILSHYYTVKGYGEHELVIQKSRFICYIDRTSSEEQAQDFIQRIKKKHWDATHNCSAYLIGKTDRIQKANDDGEPSGTAGVPILEVLKKRNLKNCVVVVTRYFGGTKLGAGGLIRAYGKSTSECLNHTGIVKRKLMRIMEITFDYTWLGKLENELRNSNYILKEIHYLNEVKVEVYVEEALIKQFVDWMIELTSGRCEINSGELIYTEEDINK